MTNFDSLFAKFDSIFNGTSSKKENNKTNKKVKDDVKKPKKRKFYKKDKVHVEDMNGNEIEAYWDDEIAKEFQNRKIKNIIKNLHR